MPYPTTCFTDAVREPPVSVSDPGQKAANATKQSATSLGTSCDTWPFLPIFVRDAYRQCGPTLVNTNFVVLASRLRGRFSTLGISLNSIGKQTGEVSVRSCPHYLTLSMLARDLPSTSGQLRVFPASVGQALLDWRFWIGAVAHQPQDRRWRHQDPDQRNTHFKPCGFRRFAEMLRHHEVIDSICCPVLLTGKYPTFGRSVVVSSKPKRNRAISLTHP